jgi:hypothetical protein
MYNLSNDEPGRAAAPASTPACTSPTTPSPIMSREACAPKGRSRHSKHSDCHRLHRWDAFVGSFLGVGVAIEITGWDNGGQLSHWLRDVARTDTTRGRVIFAAGCAMLTAWTVVHILDPDDNWIFDDEA